MKHLVVYLSNTLRWDRRVLEPVFGRMERDSVLPFVSPLLADEQVSTALAKLGEFEGVLIQPVESEVPAMTLDEALGLVQAQDAWTKLLRAYAVRTEDVSIRAKEYPRCWLILANAVPVGMPPGAGYIVDKSSREVFERRYIDVGGHLNVFQ